MGAVFLIGRILVGGYYLMSAVHHFSDLGPMARMVGHASVPLPQVAIVLSGLLLAIAGFSLLFGLYPNVGVGALVLFLVPVTLVMHAFWADHDPQRRQMDLINFTKNMGLLGSSLMFLAIPRPWAYSLERRVHLPVHLPV